MVTALYPGSFDPPTLGHIDVITRAATLFKQLHIAIVVNPNKKGLFSIQERAELLSESLADIPHVSIDTFQGLLVDYVQAKKFDVIVKGLRSAQDFEYELPMDHMNKHLGSVDTIYLATDPRFSFVSSSLIREVALLGGDISGLVPQHVAQALTKKLHNEQGT